MMKVTEGHHLVVFYVLKDVFMLFGKESKFFYSSCVNWLKGYSVVVISVAWFFPDDKIIYQIRNNVLVERGKVVVGFLPVQQR